MQVSRKLINGLGICDMSLPVFINELTGKPKIDEEYLWVCIQVSICVYHDIFQLEIVVGPLGAMSVLEDAHQLVGNIDDFLDLLHPIEFAEILLKTHFVKWHDKERH